MFYDLISVQRCQQAVWAYVGRRARWAVEELLCAMMQSERDQFLGCQPHQRCAARRGYRNGHYVRYLHSRQGLLTLRVPRVRQCPEAFHTQVLVRYQRRCAEVDLAVLRWVGGGMSTRKAAGAFQQAFHGVLSAGTVSRIVARLDAQIRAFHSRSLHREGYRYVFFDAKHGYTCHRRRRRGRGKKKKGALLLAWAARHNGREELIDFRAVDNENEKNWTAFMTDLQRRGLKLQDRWGRDLEMIVSDGDGGLLEAL